ncbi:MAG: PEP/pyruvate-binding domain-containing protein [Gemmatimonadaceae bacterium]
MQHESSALIRSFGADGATPDAIGGKAANLWALVRAGFPVPAGFAVTTLAYRQFVSENGLEPWVKELAQRASDDGSDAVEEASRAIRARFDAGRIPQSVADAVRCAYTALKAPAVAVRSSATTEDLPELSFAGQQDTFLNVVDVDAVLRATLRCWSSLWTARAISYRGRHRVPHEGAAVAVVVQAMVQSEVAGVLFTANPLTGLRSETVIDATWGLGEALVSGQVEPDHYTVDVGRLEITSRTIGAKAVATLGLAGGGTTTVKKDPMAQQALPDDVIVSLAKVGNRIAHSFGGPQDIEWAWANSKIWVLQSRPITSLFPLPGGLPSEPLQVLFSLGAVQGMLDPFTPLGRDMFQHGAARVSSLLGPPVTLTSQRVLIEAAERIFVNVTGALRSPHTRPIVLKALSVVEPDTGRALRSVLADPRLGPQAGRRQVRSTLQWVRLLGFVARLLTNAGIAALLPDVGRRRVQRRVEHVVAAFASDAAAAQTLADRVALCEGLIGYVARFAPLLMPALAVGMGSLRCLHYLIERASGADELIMATTRGLPHNVTTEMDLALWQTAASIGADASAAIDFRDGDVETLSALFLAGGLPATAQRALDVFLQRYGMRGVAEIDIGRTRWDEDPRLLVQTLQSYLKISDPARVPDAVFARGAKAAERAIQELEELGRESSYGWARAQLIRWCGRRVRALAGLRETPKFTVIRLLGIARRGLLASGQELVRAGVLDRADDLFFLHFDELRLLSSGDQRAWRALIAARRVTNEREGRRRQIPRLLLSDGRAVHGGLSDDSSESATLLTGTPVSAGIVEGNVRVVLEPHTTPLAVGEILVCPGTDPAWTPLFLSAGGLVTEVGGLITHGSVVAREYGIPAVVGVHHATTRLVTGMRVRVDGSRGTITVLTE